uniref:Uncharacterized protein n=1 Tax=Leptobrachium leishanense TaxID=445787 RepID=A0A8C5M416_9ANUR
MACDLREELNCAVCLNIYKDPVTLTCGHSFCQLCIENFLDTQQRCGAYSCPNCRAEFSERPVLQRSTALCNIAECVHATSPDVGVLCSYCVNQSIPAVKTCLMCEAALCETHLQVHCKSAEHILKEPTTYQGNRKCTVHREVLKYICSHDRTFVCVSCCLAGDHRGHYVELLESASEKTKEKMKNVLKKLSANRSETEEDILNLQNHGKELLEQAASVGKRVTTLFRDIHVQLDTLEKRLHSELSSQEKRFSRRVSDQILKLEVKKEKLSERMCRIEELCNLTDPLMVLQERESSYRKFFEHEDSSTEEEEEEEEGEAEAEEEEYERGPEDCSWEEDEDEEDEDEDDDEDSEDEWFDSVGGLDEGSIAMTLQKALPDIVNNELRDFYVRPAKGLLLDPKTAASSITISDDLRKILAVDAAVCPPENPERFDYSQVLSSCTFSSGRIFFDVETTSEFGVWSIGMAYPSIERGWSRSTIGYNEKSWSLSKKGGSYLAVHDSRETLVPSPSSNRTLRIYLDYEAGQLSFYEFGDPLTHLHTFTTTFSEPLHAAFYVWTGVRDIPSIELL